MEIHLILFPMLVIVDHEIGVIRAHPIKTLGQCRRRMSNFKQALVNV